MLLRALLMKELRLEDAVNHGGGTERLEKQAWR